MASNPTFDSTGLDILRTADVRQNMRDGIQGSSEFGPQAEIESDKLLGQLIDVPAERIGVLYELLQSLYDSWDLDNAEGIHLENLCKLVGVYRQDATYSTVTLTLGGTAGTTIDAGKRAKVPDSTVFALDDDATIGVGGTVDATATATEAGPQEASAGSVTEIVDAVSGWSSVTNAADATVGEAEETDAALRRRRQESLSAGGTGTDVALQAALERLDDITAAVVISNRSLATSTEDELGAEIPGKRYMAVIWPSTGIDTDRVVETIWSHESTGSASYGSESATITDGQGFERYIYYEYASSVDIYWDITVTTNSEYPTNGDDLVESATLTYGSSLSVGDDVLPLGAMDSIYDSVPGITHLVVEVGTSPAPSGTVPVTISPVEISDHDSARVTVTS